MATPLTQSAISQLACELPGAQRKDHPLVYASHMAALEHAQNALRMELQQLTKDNTAQRLAVAHLKEQLAGYRRERLGFIAELEQTRAALRSLQAAADRNPFLAVGHFVEHGGHKDVIARTATLPPIS